MHTMLKLRRRIANLCAMAVLVAIATPAFAGTMYFAEVLTASEFKPAANVRATLDAGVLSVDPLNILFNGEITADAGLGSGYLSGSGDFIAYTHRFTPSLAWQTVTHATLLVSSIDDQWFDGGETVEIELNDAFWMAGNAAFNLFGGDVTALFSSQEDELSVKVISRKGDAIIPLSAMIWKYETADGPDAGTGARPVPEPTALALFGIGALLVQRAARSRH